MQKHLGWIGGKEKSELVCLVLDSSSCWTYDIHKEYVALFQ